MTKTDAAKNAAVSAVMTAILIVSKFILHFVPNVEIITPLIIIFTCSIGFKRTLFAVLVFCAADNFLYSFSYLVTIQYFFHWPLLCILTGLLSKKFVDNSYVFASLALFMGLLFWIETALINEIFNFTKFLPTLISGILFMVPMTAGGLVFTFLAYKPLSAALRKIHNNIFNRS